MVLHMSHVKMYTLNIGTQHFKSLWNMNMTFCLTNWLPHYPLSPEGCVCLVTQSRPALCNPMDCSSPGSSVHRIFQARILKWVAISSSKVFSWPGIEPRSPALAGRFFYHWATWEALVKDMFMYYKVEHNE